MSIRVVIADDQVLFRAGLRMILKGNPDIDVIGDADSGQAAILAVRRQRPEVVLMDLRMPGVDGVEATRQIVHEEKLGARVIVLTTFEGDEEIVAALRAGASGYLLKDLEPAALFDAIRIVASGGAMLAPSVTRHLLDRFAERLTTTAAEPASRLAQLSEREIEVLRLLGQGMSNREIADQIVVTEPTVKSHVSNLLLKLDLRDRTQAVIAAYEAGVIRPGAIRAS
jgi:DNA-binding NarL/FixJ family response regulator